MTVVKIRTDTKTNEFLDFEYSSLSEYRFFSLTMMHMVSIKAIMVRIFSII